MGFLDFGGLRFKDEEAAIPIKIEPSKLVQNKTNKLAKIRRHASPVHFAKIHSETLVSFLQQIVLDHAFRLEQILFSYFHSFPTILMTGKKLMMPSKP